MQTSNDSSCMRKTPVQLGSRFGNLTIVGDYIDKHRHFITLCDCGAITTKRAVNVLHGKTTSCGNHGHGVGRREMDQPPTYKVIHNTLTALRGSASNYRCTDCPNPAREWSYDLNDLHELQGYYNNQLLRYSLDVEHYEPRCIRCHRQYDAGFRAA